jgi:hypothetical protein
MPIKNPKELERVALKVLLSEDEVEKMEARFCGVICSKIIWVLSIKEGTYE